MKSELVDEGKSKIAAQGSVADRRVKTTTPRVSLLTSLVVLPPLAIFGELLITQTHHRPLAAVTFGTVALILWGAVELFTRTALNPERGPRAARARQGLFVLSSLLSLAVFARALF